MLNNFISTVCVFIKNEHIPYFTAGTQDMSSKGFILLG
jgi:hypothetical protein